MLILRKVRRLTLSIMLVFIMSIYLQNHIFAESNKIPSNAEKVRAITGGTLYKVKENGKVRDVIVLDNGTVEDYTPNKHSKLITTGKINKDLKEEMNKVKDKDNILVAIWFKEIDYNLIDKQAKNNTNINNIDNETDQKLQKYIEKKRELIKTEYNTKNKKYFSKYIPNETVLFISNYAPFIIASISAKNIDKLSKNDDVVSVELFRDLPKTDETNYSIPNINANFTRDTKLLKGSGIKVGIVESGYADKANSQLNDRQITFDIPDSQSKTISSHATKITSIIVGKTQGIVPNASVYLAGSKSRTEDYQKIEWCIDQGCNVINFSAGYSDLTGVYSEMAKWIDHLAFQSNVAFVKSAGNGGEYYGITDPGMAYNGLTIGSINDADSINEPNWNDDKFSSFSSFLETEGGFKPDLTAPGEGISVAGFSASNGTSYSAPYVTGVIAQLFNLKPELKVKQAALHSILAAGTNHKTATDYGIYNLISDYSDKEGAGVIDAKGAYNVINTNKYLQTTIYNDSFPYQKSFTINTTGKPVRIVLNWIKQNLLTDGSIVSRDLSDLDLVVVKPDGTEEISCSANNNSELVEFIPSITGTYTIRVEGYLLLNTYEIIGLSWNQ